MKRTAVATLLLVAAACGRDEAVPPGGRVVLVTQVPAGIAPTGAGERHASGSRVLRLDLDDPTATPVDLSAGLDAAGDARISHDARRVVFVGRERADEPFALWQCSLDGRGRRRLVPGAAACGAGVLLPDGRVAHAADTATGRSLFVADGDGAAGRRITFGIPVLAGPAVTRDGRLLFVGRPGDWLAQPAPREAGALFTVHPDGTGVALLHGPVAPWPLAVRQAATDGAVVHAVAEASGPGRASLHDWRAPAEAAVEVALPTGAAACVEPTADGRLLVAARDVDAGRSGLVLVERDGAVAGGPWPDPDGWRTIDVVEVAPRPRPQGQLSSVDTSLEHGELLCVDARRPGREAAAVAVVRAGRASESRPGTLTWETLGRIPLEADGSFFVEVPADTPLLVDLLDAAGGLVEESRTPFWLRPGEKRACVGCHEAPDTTPPNRRPLAVLKAPVPLGLAAVAGVGQ